MVIYVYFVKFVFMVLVILGEKDVLIFLILFFIWCKIKKFWFGKGRSDRGSFKFKGILKKEFFLVVVYDFLYICL